MGTICVHKGLAPDENPSPEIGHPSDIPKAARDWPHLNFIIYHSCIRPRFFMFEALQDLRSGATRDGVPDIEWTTEFAQLAAPFRNVYGEIGTTFASTVITFPTVCAHILGQLVKYLGPNRVVFGSDSVWYGSPQWQIEAFWRFEIPHEMRRRYRYPALTKRIKRKILGLNSARIYKLAAAPVKGHHGGHDDDWWGRRHHYRPVPKDFERRIPDSLKTLWEFPGYTSDNLERMRTQYAEMNLLPGNIRYGWVRRA
jgi:predicted TIM-barrel fold metal-dependent hydrolase